MRMPLSSRLIFTAVGLSLPVAAHKADMNQTHIYNPKWSPHAKFHDGQTLSMSILLGGLTTFLAWKSSRNVRVMVAGAALAGSLYFITQGTAILYPGTEYFDPEFAPEKTPRIPAGVKIDVVYLSAVAIASVLGLLGRRDAQSRDARATRPRHSSAPADWALNDSCSKRSSHD